MVDIIVILLYSGKVHSYLFVFILKSENTMLCEIQFAPSTPIHSVWPMKACKKVPVWLLKSPAL